MEALKKNLDLKKTQADIANKVRELRKQRRWTQAELSKLLAISQSRLSEIEKGAGSFTAEQFLLLLQLFNVTVSHFAPLGAQKKDAELQNALARLGAVHLQESADVLPSERLETVAKVVYETLTAAASARQLTALAPVLVRNIDGINLHKLGAQLANAGLERRFGWLLENILTAVRHELPHAQPRPWAQWSRRTEVILSMFLEYMDQELRSREFKSATSDILDPDIRSRKSLEEVKAASSNISKLWGIATSLQPEDFIKALRAVRAGN